MSRSKMDATQSVRIDVSVLKEIRKEAAERKTTQRVIVEDAWAAYKRGSKK